MIALCRHHHPEADTGAFSNDDLRELKRTGREKARLLGARFNWMREQLLVRVGSVFHYETPIAIRIGERPIVWFNRNEANKVLVNLSTPSASGDPRLEMRDNFWLTEGTNLRALKCPPSGKVVQARYANDDLLRTEFRNIASLEELDRRYQPNRPKTRRRPKRLSPEEPGTSSSYADPVAREHHFPGCGRRDHHAPPRHWPPVLGKQDRFRDQRDLCRVDVSPRGGHPNRPIARWGEPPNPVASP
jgi:hypothetical protein